MEIKKKRKDVDNMKTYIIKEGKYTIGEIDLFPDEVGTMEKEGFILLIKK